MLQKKHLLANNDLDQKTLQAMLQLYCSRNHQCETSAHNGLCSACSELLEYTLKSTESCDLKAMGQLCSKCKVHCFTPDEREKIRLVMRYSGPRLVFKAPILTLRYLIMKFSQR